MDTQITPGTTNIGSIHAVSAVTGKTEWKFEQRAGILSLLTTGGGLLFGGDVAGRFRAFDQRTGKVLWETNLGSQVTGFPDHLCRGRAAIHCSERRPGGEHRRVSRAGARAQAQQPQRSLYLCVAAELADRARRAAPPTPCRSGDGSGAAGGCRQRPPPSAASRMRSHSRQAATAVQLHAGAGAAGQEPLWRSNAPPVMARICAAHRAAPALADAGFRSAWAGRSVQSLLDCTRSTMPPGRAGTLSEAEYLSLLALILDANGHVLSDRNTGLIWR